MKILILIFILFSTRLAESQVLIHSKINEKDYPLLNLDFYALDSQNQLIKEYLPQSSKLTLNNKNEAITKIDYNQGINRDSISIIFDIDISASMNEAKIQKIKNSIAKYISLLGEDSEFALLTFNYNSYLNQDFTNDISKIINALSFINSFGGSNLDIALIENANSALNLAQKSKFPTQVILITDGISDSKTQDIINAAISKNVKINALILDNEIPTNIEQICNESGGFFFDLLMTQSEIDNALAYTILKISEASSYSFSWNSKDCEKQLNLLFETEIDDKKFKIQENFGLSLQSINSFNVLPSNTYSFGKVVKNSSYSTTFQLVSNQIDVTITEIENIDSRFTIENTLPFTITKNIPFELKVKYIALDTLYHFQNVKLISSNCDSKNIFLTAGINELGDTLNKLIIKSPLKSEFLLAKDYYDIIWEGSLPNEEIQIEFSSNNGSTWNTITKTATQNKYRWNTPDNESQNCKLRLRKLSPINKLKNVGYINLSNEYVKHLDWSHNNEKIIFTTNKNNLSAWKASQLKLDRDIFSNTTNFFAMDHSPSNSLVAASFQAISNDIGVWNVDIPEEIPLKLTSNDARASSLNFNGDGNFLSAGLENGDIVIWSLSSPNTPVHSIENAHNGKINFIKWNSKFPYILSTGADKTLKIWNSNDASNVNQGIIMPDSITGISWSPDGKMFSLVTNNANFTIYFAISNQGQISVSPKKFIKRENNSGFNHKILGTVWSSDSRYVLTYSESYIEVWDIESGDKIYTFTGHKAKISQIKSNSNNDIASASVDGQILIWNLNNIPFDVLALQESDANFKFAIEKLKLNIPNINLGTYCLNTQKDSIVSNYFASANNAIIEIDSVKFSNTNQEFQTDLHTPFSITKNQSLDFAFSFLPKTIGNKNEQVTFFIGDNIITKSLNAIAIKPDLELIQNSIDLGIYNLDEKNKLKPFILHNKGKQDVKIKKISRVYQNNDFNFTFPKADTILKVNEILEFQIEFEPSNLGITEELLKIETEEFCTPIYLPITAEVRSPKLSTINALKFETQYCEIEKDTSFVIQNFGNNFLEIKSLSLENNSGQIKIKSISKNVIAAKDSSVVVISFISSTLGSFSDNLIIKTNMQNDFTSSKVITISGERKALDIRLSTSKLEFLKLSEQNSDQKSFLIRNFSDLPVTFDFPIDYDYFVLDSISPALIEANGDSSIAYIRFKGANSGNYAQIHSFKDRCKNVYNIELFAEVIGNSSEIQVQKSIKFPANLCLNKQLDTTLYIKNTGSSSLQIDTITISSNPLSEFTLDKVYSNLLIEPNELDSIKVHFWAGNTGVNKAKVEIISNAKNENNGISEINLEIEQQESRFEIPNPILELGQIAEFQKEKTNFDIVNLSLNDALILTPQDFTNFVLDSISPNPINAKVTAKAYLTFKGANRNTIINDTLEILDLCGNIYTVYANATISVPNNLILKAKEIDVSIGEQFKFEFAIENPNNLVIDLADSIRLELKANSSLFDYVEQFGEFEIKNSVRTFSIILAYKDFISDKALSNDKFIATLGDTNKTKIEVISAKLIKDDRIQIASRDIDIFINNVCYEGGPRFISNTGRFALYQNNPNPANESTEIKFSLIERGRVTIKLFNHFGEMQELILDAEMVPGEYKQLVKLTNLPIGNYYYILESKSYKELKKMTIMR